MKALLEASGFGVPNRKSLSDFIPLILEEERKEVISLVSGNHVSVIFDGTSHQGEAMAIILRFISADLSIHQKLVRFAMLEKSVSNRPLGGLIIDVLGRMLRVPPNLVVGFVHDGASVNIAASRDVLQPLYTKAIDICCLSHMYNNVGEKISTAHAESFLSAWNSIVNRSPAARAIIRGIFLEEPKRLSMTRWYSWWEIANQLLKLWGFVPAAVDVIQKADLASAAVASLLNLLQNQKTCIQIELAFIVDIAGHLVTATYSLVSMPLQWT